MKIASLFGGAVAQTQEPDASIIELLENVLESARSGEVAAVAVVTVTPGDKIKTAWQSLQGFSPNLGFGISILERDYTEDYKDGSDS